MSAILIFMRRQQIAVSLGLRVVVFGPQTEVREHSRVCIGALTGSLRFASSSSSSLSSVKFVDHYKRLAIDIDAKPAEIKAAYRKRALECHPDVVAADNKSLAEAEFRQVSESYELLADTTRRKEYDKEHRKIVPPKMRIEKKMSKTSSANVTASSKPTTRAKTQDVKERSSSKTSSSAAAASSAAKRHSAFVRRDADRIFKDAFDGMTLDDVIFQIRRRQRQKEKEAREKKAAVSSQDVREPKATESGEEKHPAGHDEVLLQVMAEAAERFSEKISRAYGPEMLKHAKVVRLKAPSHSNLDTPPATVLPFRPFVGMELPPGVTVMPDPVMGPTTHVTEDTVESLLSDGRMQMPCKEPSVIPAGALNPKTRDATLVNLKSEASMPHNVGQMYTYHRPY